MSFWIGLVLFGVICIIIERLLKSPQSMVVPYVLLGILWFISLFRYMIGWDYENYTNMFYFVNTGTMYPEISFVFIAKFLRENDFDFQMIFVVYSTIMYFFLWKGISKYTNNTSVKLLALVVFMLSKDLMWSSFSIIRQFVAIAIVFWGGYYAIVKKPYKFVISVLVAACFHYSAIISLILYFIPHKKLQVKIYATGVIVLFIMLYSNFIPELLEVFLASINMYEGYLSSDGLQYSSGIFLIYNILLLFLFIYFCGKDEGFFINMYFTYLVFIIVLAFSAPIARLKEYFFIFYIVTYARVIVIINSRIRSLGYMLLIPLVVIYLSSIHSINTWDEGILSSRISANNIEYKFNFDIFQK